MRRKYICYMLLASMVLGNTGCTQQAKSDKPVAVDEVEDTQEETVEDQDPSEESSATDEDTKENDQSATEKAQKDESGKTPLEITFEKCDGVSEEDKEYIEGYYPVVTVVGEDYPELKTAIEEYFDGLKNTYMDTVAQFVEDAKLQKEEVDEDYFYKYSLEYMAHVERMDDNVTTIFMNEYSYMGGAHGGMTLYAINFDSKTGEEIKFEDLGVTKEEMRNATDQYVALKRKDQEGALMFYEDNIDRILESPNWYLNAIGLNLIFNQYDIASYAEGACTVTIPFSDMKKFNQKYVNASDSFYTGLDIGVPLNVDVTGDQNPETIELIQNTDENNEAVISVRVNEMVQNIVTCSYVTGAYFISCENGSKYFVIGCDLMSSDYQTFLVEIKGDNELSAPIVLNDLAVDTVWGEKIKASGYLNALGTYGATQEYVISDGVFVPQNPRFEFANNVMDDFRRGPVSKVELKVRLQKDGEMVETELPAGTKIYPVNTDNKSVVGFELEDGSYGEIDIEIKEGMVYINGVSDFDLFDDLPYAG